jgi:nucleotide-binding universal stress UspA family protein
LNIHNLLLAHHGTPGALRAEALACAWATPGLTRITHLLVVPDLWAGMQGDDWLNNASTRDDFGNYVEGVLAKENAEIVNAVRARLTAIGLEYTPVIRFGDPATCLLEVARDQSPDLVVIGPPRLKGAPGYRSRMELETLVRGLNAPLMVAHAG